MIIKVIVEVMVFNMGQMEVGVVYVGIHGTNTPEHTKHPGVSMLLV